MFTNSSAPSLICASTIYHASTLTALKSIYTLARLSSPMLLRFPDSSKPRDATTFSPTKMNTSHNSFKPSFKPSPISLSAFYTHFHYPLTLHLNLLMPLPSTTNYTTFTPTLTTNYPSFTTTSTLLLFNAPFSHITPSTSLSKLLLLAGNFT